MIAMIDLKKPRRTTQADVSDLGGILTQLIGEPFLFSRPGYANELTLHFGTSYPAEHPRLRAKGLECGSYILSVCASTWLLKSSTQSRLIVEGLPVEPIAHWRRSINQNDDAKAALATNGLIPVGSSVAVVVPYEIEQAGGIALRLETADGSGVIVVPRPELDPETNQPIDFPDWELRTPAGLARVGPGRQWTWEPKSSAFSS